MDRRELACVTLLLSLLLGSLIWPQGVTAPVPHSFFILAGLIGVAACIPLWHRSRRVGPAGFTLWALVIWTALSCWNSVDLYLSLVFAANLFAGFLAFSLAAACRSNRAWEVIVFSCSAALLLHASSGLTTLTEGGALRANFTNPDCYSLLPLGCYFLCLGLRRDEDRSQTLISTLAALVMCLMVALTGCRASFAGIFLGLGLLLALARSEPRLRGTAAVGLFLPILGLSLLLALGQVSKATQKWQRLLSNRDPGGIKSRLDVLRHSPETALERPLLGSGPGTFHLVYQSQRPELSVEEDFMNVAHNDYAQFLVDTGLPGGLLFLAFCLGLLGGGLRRPPTVKLAAAASGWLAILVYMTLNFAFPVAACSVWSLAFAGLLRAAQTSSQPSSERSLHLPLCALLLLGSAFLLTVGYSGHKADRSRTRAKALAEDLLWRDAYQALEPALNFQPYNKELFVERSRLAMRLGLLLGEAGWLEQGISDLTSARELSPLDVEIHARLARAQERAGKLVQAEQNWRASLVLAPTNWRLQQGLVRNLLLQGRLKEAVTGLRALGPTRFSTAYGELLGLLEHLSPGEGLTNYREVLRDHPAAVARKVVLGATTVLEELGSKERRLEMLRAYLQAHSGDLCLELQYLESLTPGGAGPTGHRHLLELALQESEDPQSMDCAHRALLLWARAKLAEGQPDEQLLTHLNDRLRKHPELVEVRLLASRAYLVREDRPSARTVLREGLEHDPKGSVHAALGALFYEGGHFETADDYYREALRRNPKVTEWERRLQAIQIELEG